MKKVIAFIVMAAIAATGLVAFKWNSEPAIFAKHRDMDESVGMFSERIKLAQTRAANSFKNMKAAISGLEDSLAVQPGNAGRSEQINRLITDWQNEWAGLKSDTEGLRDLLEEAKGDATAYFEEVAGEMAQIQSQENKAMQEEKVAELHTFWNARVQDFEEEVQMLDGLIVDASDYEHILRIDITANKITDALDKTQTLEQKFEDLFSRIGKMVEEGYFGKDVMPVQNAVPEVPAPPVM